MTSKIRNGSIPLPAELRKTWKGMPIFLIVSGDTLTVKRMGPPPTLGELKPILKEVGKRVTQKDIDKAVAEARKELRKKRKKS